MASVTVGFIGNVREVTIEPGITTGELLQQTGLQLRPEYTLFVSGKTQDLTHPLMDGDVVLLICPIRGEYTARVKGRVWRLHKYDVDTAFPSDLHAHNCNAPEVVDLYSGHIYDKKTRKLLRQMPKKEFKQLLEAFCLPES